METKTGHSRLDNLIELYCSGNMDKASLAELRKLALESDDNHRYVRERLELWLSSGMVEKQENPLQLNRKFHEIEQRIAEVEEDGTTSFKLPWRWGRWVAAAVLVALLPLGGYLWGVRTSSGHLSGVTMETAFGARTMVYLPDSTLVWLNAGSKLAYSRNYGVSDRKVTLQGEALFDVRHNKKLPFEVNSKEVNLKVLGTRFVFSDYPDDKTVTIDLVRGKVFLEGNTENKQQLYLSPNERMVLCKETGRMRKQAIDATLSDSWTKGRLFFDEVSLADIAKELSRSYNVRIKVMPSMQDDVFYGSFDMKQNTLEDILRIISSTKQMKYRYKDGEYILY